MKLSNKIILIVFLFLGMIVKGQDTLTMMSYNILNYPISNPSKADTLKPIIQHVQPDIFMITELTSSTGATTILNNALNVGSVSYYQKAAYFNGPDTDNMMFCHDLAPLVICRNCGSDYHFQWHYM